MKASGTGRATSTRTLNTRSRLQAGFTMLEVMITVTLLIILMGVAFVAVQNYQRTLKQLELDEMAKDIYIAAQNHLTVAAAQGELADRTGVDKTDDTGSPPEYFFAVAPNDSRLASSSSSVLAKMLPKFSLDDTVRLGGSYVIAYDPGSATVTDVFYSDAAANGLSEKTFVAADYSVLLPSAEKDGYAGVANKDKRLGGYEKQRNQIIGWYGGASASTASEPIPLPEPRVEMTNGDQLVARVVFDADAYSGVEVSVRNHIAVQVTITGLASGHTQLLNDSSVDSTPGVGLDTVQGPDYELSYILDDVTQAGKHFAEQFCESTNDQVLIPGEDVRVSVKLIATNQLSNIVWVQGRKVNSLFGKVTRDSTNPTILESSGVTASVASIRHLENIAPTISGYDPSKFPEDTSETDGEETSGSEDVPGFQAQGSSTPQVSPYYAKKFEQTTDLSWTSFTNAIAMARTATTDSEDVAIYVLGQTSVEGAYGPKGSYVPVTPDPQYFSSYDGKGHSIKKVHVGPSEDANNNVVAIDGPVGLFSELQSSASTSTEIKNLRLVDFSIEGTSSAGALAGSLSGVDVSNVVAYAKTLQATSAVVGGSNAGGLVGTMTNGTLTGVAASLYVRTTGNGSAGGLVGSATAGEGAELAITASYSGGHTTEGIYETQLAVSDSLNEEATQEESDDEESSSDVPFSYVNVQSEQGTAGGLVGSSSGNVSIENCYATTSVWAGLVAGGFVGSASGTAITNCYATGLVTGAEGAAQGAFAGSATGAQFLMDDDDEATNRFFEIINEGMPAVGGAETLPEGISALDKSVATYNEFFKSGDDAADAEPYDTPWLVDHYGGKYPYPSILNLVGSSNDDSDESVDDEPEASEEGEAPESDDDSQVALEDYFVATHYGDWPSPETFVVNTKADQ